MEMAHSNCARSRTPSTQPDAWYRSPRVGEAATELELVRRIGAGERDAWAEAELCARFAPRVRLYGLKHLRDEERARDLAQQVLVTVLVALREGRLSDPALLPRFVLGISRNLALKMFAQGRREAPSSNPLPEEVSVPSDPEWLTPQRLQPCAEQLQGRAQTVIRMSFMEERSSEEIASALGTTVGNVRVIRHRALAQLRECVEGGRDA